MSEVSGDKGAPNPAAFPHFVPDGHYNGSVHYEGMTLRDWFAGHALAGILANTVAFGAHFQGDPELIASAAGTFADAMLRARGDSL